MTPNTTGPTISLESVNGNTMQFTHTSIGGTYTPAYTTYRFTNSNNQTTNHQWYDGSDHGTTTPSAVNVSTLNPTYKWSIYAGNSYCSIDEDSGELTLQPNVGSNIVVRLTVSNISPLDDKTVDYNITRASVAQAENNIAEISDVSLSPLTASLDLGQSEDFVAFATVNLTTITIPAHVTLNCNGTVYYYYNSTLYTSAEGFQQETSTHPEPAYEWEISSESTGYMTMTHDHEEATVTYTNQAPSALVVSLTVNAKHSGIIRSKTAVISGYAPLVAPTITANGSRVSISTPSLDAQIYYTLDDGDPRDPDNPDRMLYNGAFYVPDSPVTVKATAYRNGNYTSVTETQLTLQLTPPAAEFFPDSEQGLHALAELIGHHDGLTIYYTTDGSDPTTSSNVYSDLFDVTDGTTVKAIAVKDGWITSNVSTHTYYATQLETPIIKISALGVRFTSQEDDVTYYYTTNGNTPTTSDTPWHRGDDPITHLADNTTIKVMTVKSGYVNSEVAEANYQVLSHYVFLYNDHGVYHFLGNDYGTPANYLFFHSQQIVWAGKPVVNSNDTLMLPVNEGWYLHLCNESGGSNTGELHFVQEATPTHTLVLHKVAPTDTIGMVLYYDNPQLSDYYLHYYNSTWSAANEPFDWNQVIVVHEVTGEQGDDYAVHVVSLTPSVNHMGMHVLYPPADGDESTAETMTIVGGVMGDNPSYLPDFYQVGFPFNPIGYFIEGGNTLLSQRPTVSTAFNFSYEFVDDAVSEWCTIEGNVVKYIKDPGHDMEIEVRVIASPVGYSGVTREAIATFTIISDPPLTTPTITQLSQSNYYRITTTDPDAVIQYKLDDGNWYQYYGPIEVTTMGTVITARNYREDTGQTSSEVTYTVSGALLSAPLITFDQSGKVTLTDPNDFATGCTIYYTTTGTDPNTSSTAYSAPFTVPSGTTVKAIVISNYYTDSDIAEALVLYNNVTGGTVTLYDYEDHTWTYYAGVDSSVDGGDYNNNYASKLHSPDPRNVKITYQANKGAVSISEADTMFVYYKTIEKVDGAYKYIVISNPFSKRPTGKGFGGWKIISGGGATNGSGYIANHKNGDVLSLDEELTLTNLNSNYTPNCTSAEIVLQANWVNLNNIVRRTQTGDYTYSTTGGTYETNILVIQRSQTGTITTSSPVTIMMVEPDGSADYRNDYTFTGNITPNNNGVTKIEFTKWNSTNTLNCNNHSVTIGRGMTTTSQCASYVKGVNSTTSQQQNQRPSYTANLNYHLKIESGVFTNVSFIAGYDDATNGYGYVNCNGTSNQVKGTLGNDYDRAKKDNTKLDITSNLFLGYMPSYADGNQNSANFTCWVKSGNLCSGTNVTNTTFNNQGVPNGGYYGDASQVFYVSIGGAQTNIGKRKVYVEGGILSGIAGGIDSNNPADAESFFLRMTGGQVRGVVYGSGAFAASSGIRRFIVTGGTINGWVAAGCNGTNPTQSGGTLPSNTYVYIGGTSYIGNATDLTLNTSTDGNVFGAGSGNSAQATTGQVNNSNVVIADECYIKNNVFGGGNYGYSNATATVYVTGGNVAGAVFGGSNQKQGVTVNVNTTGGLVEKGIYGGSNITGTISGNVTMHINGGQVGVDSEHPGNIHGGGYGSATIVSGTVDLTLGTETQTTPGVTVYGDVYGGSALGTVNTANGNDSTLVTMNAGLINGSLYGGALGDLASLGTGHSNVAALVYGPVHVTVNGGSIKPTDGTGLNGSGAVFGCNNVNGQPQQTVHVDINNTDHPTALEPFALFAVYGGGNKADYAGKPLVHVNGCINSINYVYGGGNAADVNETEVVIWGGHIGYVFGGGNGSGEGNPGADVTLNGTNVAIHGGMIENVFGGSNARGSIEGDISVTIEELPGACALNLTNVYGGGNMADITGDSNIEITIGCGVGPIMELYGGSKKANIEGDVTLTIYSGIIDDVYGGSQGTIDTPADIGGDVTLNIYGGDIGNVFGGSNINGNIDGAIHVTIDWSQSSGCTDGTNQLENVYGGSNLAQYTPTASRAAEGNYPLVTLTNGVVGRTVARSGHPVFDPNNLGSQGNVFGGGKGSVSNPDAGRITAKPKVVMNPSSENGFIVLNAIYGGGEVASVVGNTTVEITNGHVGSATRDLYEDNGFVFGGGKGSVLNPMLANVQSNATVTISGGYVHNTVFGGGEIAAVGNFTRATSEIPADDVVIGEPVYCAPNTGKTTVHISGGQIGPVNVTMLADLGYVFGAGMGVYTQPKVDYTDPFFNSTEMARQNGRFGYVDNTEVVISDNAFVVGAVWGGSENGQVLHDCRVNIQGGQIGCGKNLTAPYTNEQWAAAKAAVLSNNLANIAAIAAQMPECDSWDYDGDNGHNYLPYDPYADDDGLTNASDPGYDGHTFFGNVFGGGSGYYGYRITEGSNPTRNVWFDFQGRVRGNTYLNITGGHILTSAYGGCEYATVLGKCTVNMSGGTLGVPRTAAQIQAHPVTCYLFGAGKGDQRTNFNEQTNVAEAEVTVNGDAVIYGSVFGGGEDGHVVGNATVTIGGNAIIGSTGTSYYDGNIFGAGRGFGGTSVLAGSIGGDATVNIGGNSKVLGSVFGGGRLASVGVYLVPDSDPNFGKLQDGKGNISVTINGGTIGNTFESNPSAFDASTTYAIDDFVAYDNKLWRFVAAHPAGAWNASHVKEVTHTTGGNVFGGSMGRLLKIGESDPSEADNLNPIWPSLALCRSTDVNISGTTSVLSNVYGGGEMGLVFEDTDVTVEANTIVGHTIGSEHYGSVYGGGYGSDVLTPHTNDSTDVTAARHAGLVYGNATVSVTGGQIKGNVFGGGEMATVGTYNYNNSTDEITSLKKASTGQATVTVTGGIVGVNSLNNGRVFGAGKGVVGANMDPYTFVDRTTVSISGDATEVRGCVFGSGDNGHVLHNTQVTVSGGTIGNNNGSPTNGNVFGSGRGADTYLVGSTPTLSPNAGRVYGSTNVTIDGNNTTIKNNVYGGGYLATVDGNTTVTIGENNDPTIYGDVFGGSALSAIGKTDGSGTTTLNVYGGTFGSTYSYYYNDSTGAHKGNIFGGGNGDAEITDFNGATNGTTNNKRAANVRNTIQVNIGNSSGGSATITGGVFGGNNIMGTPLGDVNVDVYSTAHTSGVNTTSDDGFALSAVYGGGNQADYVPLTRTDVFKPTVHIHGCDNTIDYLYGGGNAAAVPEANTIIDGGHVNWVFAGGNGYGTGNPGANVGLSTDGNTEYGTGNAIATIHGGTIDHTFAGSNAKGTIKGQTQMNLDPDGTCALQCDTIFGGSNMAYIDGDINTVIYCNPAMESVWINCLYGGCNQANVNGNVNLTVYGGSYYNVFGGSRGTTSTAANITGNVTLNMHGGRVGDASKEGNIFGGSDVNGSINGQITVNVEYADTTACYQDYTHANVYGGGNLAQYGGTPRVNIKHGTVLNVFGGGNGDPDDSTQNPGKVSGSIVTIGDDVTTHRAVVLGNVYGGGNAAKVTGDTRILLKQRAKVHGNVYGGGNMGEVGGDTKVIVNGLSGNE